MTLTDNEQFSNLNKNLNSFVIIITKDRQYCTLLEVSCIIVLPVYFTLNVYIVHLFNLKIWGCLQWGPKLLEH